MSFKSSYKQGAARVVFGTHFTLWVLMRVFCLCLLASTFASGTMVQAQVLQVKRIDIPTANKAFSGYSDIAWAQLGARALASSWNPDHEAVNAISAPGAGAYWSSSTRDVPVDLDIILPGKSPMAVAGFRLDVDMGNRAEYEVFVSRKTDGGPWESLGKVSTFAVPDQKSAVYSEPGPQAFLFTRPMAIRALRLRHFKTQYYANFYVTHIAIFAKGDDANSGLPAAVAATPRNLVSQFLEGGMIRYPGSDELAQQLIDDDVESVWYAPDGVTSPAFTFMFGESQMVMADRIELIGLPLSSGSTRPVRATISLTTDPNPTQGMRKVVTTTLNWQDNRAIIKLPPKTLARFLNLQLDPAPDATAATALSEVRIIEATVAGYQSIMVTGRALAPKDDRGAANQGSADDIEPNDTVAQTQSVAPGKPFNGVLWPQTDVDILGFDTRSGVRAEFDVSANAVSGVSASFSMAKVIDGKTPRFGFKLPVNAAIPTTLEPGNYLVRVSRPRNSSIVVVIDDSGSMSGQSDNIYSAFAAFLTTKRPDDEVGIVRFGGGITVLSDFEKDPETLRARLDEQLGNGGGSPVYRGLFKAGEMLRNRPGDRAIILISDGANSTSDDSILDVWSLLQDDRIRFYGVGFGPDLNSYTDYSIPQRTRRVLGAWAIASGGLFAEAPTGDQLNQVFSKISDDFRQPSRYRITTNLRQIPFGQIEIGSHGVLLAGADAPLIELIVDASGSMRSRKNKIDGKLKIDVAKKVLSDLVDSLPIGAQVGMRVFGQRIREGQKFDCVDVEIVQPYGTVDKAALKAEISAITPLGTTPIYTALLLAMGDLKDLPGKKVVVILTDGKEECRDPEDLPGLAALAQDFGVDLQLNIVGFALADDATKSILTRSAAVTGGQFFDAQDGKSLAASLRSAFGTLGYRVIDAQDRTIAEGSVDGPPVEVRTGNYSVDLLTGNGPTRINRVHIVANRRLWIQLENTDGSIGLSSDFKDTRPIE